MPHHHTCQELPGSFMCSSLLTAPSPPSTCTNQNPHLYPTPLNPQQNLITPHHLIWDKLTRNLQEHLLLTHTHAPSPSKPAGGSHHAAPPHLLRAH